MSNPITAADLAEALRELLEGSGAKQAPSYLTWHQANTVLCDWDAQQTETRKLETAVNATGLQRVYIVKLQYGCWLADGIGDPPITLVKSHARLFGTRQGAKRALSNARRFRPFISAEIVEIDRNPQAIAVTKKRIGGTNG